MTAQRAKSHGDEEYILDLCDEIVAREALRRHRFFFLRGTDGRKRPVAAFYPGINIVIDLVPEDVAQSDVDLRCDALARRGIRMVTLRLDDFSRDAKHRLTRSRERDAAIIRGRLAEAARPGPRWRRTRRQDAGDTPSDDR